MYTKMGRRRKVAKRVYNATERMKELSLADLQRDEIGELESLEQTEVDPVSSKKIRRELSDNSLKVTVQMGTLASREVIMATKDDKFETKVQSVLEDDSKYNENDKLDTVNVSTEVVTTLKHYEEIYLRQRHLVVAPGGFISTPLHALKALASQHAERFHKELTYIPHLHWNSGLYRVEIIVGAFRGVGEAFNKTVATQMAALDVLVRIENTDFDSSNRMPFAVLPGWRINPKVHDDLYQVCKKNGLKSPSFVTKSNVQDKRQPLYAVECCLGTTVAGYARSDFAHLARNLAAYDTINAITGTEYPLDYVAFGNYCLSYSDFVRLGYKPVMSDTKKEMLRSVCGISGTVDMPASLELDEEEVQALQKEFTFDTSTTKENDQGFVVTFQNLSPESQGHINRTIGKY